MNYYEVLGVPRDASTDDIKRAFRKIVAKVHPDATGMQDTKHPGYQDAIRPYLNAVEAYETLVDPRKRQAYDVAYEPVTSLSALFRRPEGLRFLAAMLPAAPKASKPGVDLATVIDVDPDLLEQGGVVEKPIPGASAYVVIPAQANELRFGTLKGMGESGRNGGGGGDLLVVLVPKRG